MSSVDPVLLALRRGKKAVRETGELNRLLHRGQHADDSQTPWTERPDIQAGNGNKLQEILQTGPTQRGGRAIE